MDGVDSWNRVGLLRGDRERGGEEGGYNHIEKWFDGSLGTWIILDFMVGRLLASLFRYG